MNKTVVINVVGLTRRLIGEHTPRIRDFAAKGKLVTVGPVVPGVTCSVQSTYLTGVWPSEHGIVGNGWYFRDECEIKFWRQSDKLVQRPRVWDVAKQRDPKQGGFTCANICWWYAMYSTCDYTVTPRPMYLADGRKIPDVWTNPAALRQELQHDLGRFPLFQFWGPGADMRSTHWIADAAIHVDRKYDPTLTLVYLPHLDYCLQRDGLEKSVLELDELDDAFGRLIDHFTSVARG